jgi:hypothetical protein
MESIIAEKYKVAFDALSPDKQSEPLWEQPGFEAVISNNAAPHREKILTFADGSVFDYYDHWALSETDWADRNKATIW